MAHAALIVYPSWIEGFGLPVVKGLAYGRPVLVRSMPLWREIAAHCNLPGTLMEFDDAPSLHKAVAAVLEGGRYAVIEQGRVQRPMDWRTCAGRILDGITLCLQHASNRTWIQRDKAMRFLGNE